MKASAQRIVLTGGVGPLGAYILAAATGLSYACMFPPLGWAALSWFALVPLLLALDGAGARRSAGLAATYGFISTVITTAWLVPTAHLYFDRPVWLTLVFWLTVGITCTAPYFALSFALHGYLQAHLPRLAWLLIVPVA